MSESFLKNCDEIKKKFTPLSIEERYDALMELGKGLPTYPDSRKTSDRIVAGCQSTLYLSTESKEGKIFFQAHSDALISSGLAAILILAYSGESPETILKCPPTFLNDLGISASLSPGRSNGLMQIHLRMKQEALKTFLAHSH